MSFRRVKSVVQGLMRGASKPMHTEALEAKSDPLAAKDNGAGSTIIREPAAIFGCDVLDAPKESGLEIIANETFRATGHTTDSGAIKRRPPFEVLFISEDAHQAQHALDHLYVEKINVFVASAPRGTLVGQRSLVTGMGRYLVNDTNHSNHTYRIFSSQERRNFESVHLVQDGEGYDFEHGGQPPVMIPGMAAVLTGMEQDNYGAFLLRALPKIIALRELAMMDATVIAPLNPWQRNVFTALDVDLSRFIEFDRNKTYTADTLILPSMRTSEFFIDDSTRVFFSEIAERIAYKTGKQPRHEKLYVSRISQGLARPDYRLFQNEAVLVELLREIGFHIFEPEKHSFEEQVATFNAARVVVGPSGAGMFNTIFCRPGTTVVSMEPLLTWLSLHTNMFSSMGHNYGLILGGSDPSDPSVQKRWSVDIDAVMPFLKGL
ncbi:DUF563 domain-containing protein [Agrobacterium vitis]|nr:DUF563 domain-containing protein [Agrobacterium vitis]MCF1467873.1 glycosyltransferase family 61 protein [Agrobacterium vitis]MUO69501.1 DUF563 domain-containing protein [Agrobacterium vitis]MUO87352.1 DUF563 domain-containing protein [Agrobacterium vitis]MVA36570.1 DUF563 domain-containing protein [Agrobacterium vitis]